MTQLDDAFLERLTAASGASVGKTLGMLIRPAFVARPGKTLVVGDWAAIEARVLPWLAASPGAEKVLDIFRASDADKSLPDIYEMTAAELLGKPASEVTKAERQSHGKVPVLSLGFGGAMGALQKMAVNYQVHLDDALAQAMVEGWRARNQWARDFWGQFRTDSRTGEVTVATGLWGAANMALRNPGDIYTAGRVAYIFDPSYLSGTLFCALPCGRLLSYPDCRYRSRKVKDDDGVEEEKHALWFRKGYGWSALWHGRMAENCTQATAGSILRETLVNLDREHSDWLPVIGSTHDEIVTEPAEDAVTIERAKSVLKSMMEAPTDWRRDLPLVVEITENFYYTKDPTI